MGDEELEEIRARRLGDIQKQYSGNGPSNAQREEEQRAKAADFKNQVLTQALTQEARARCVY